MKCTSVKNWLSLYVSDDCPERQHQKIVEHLAGCPNCTRELSALQSAHKAAQRIADADRPEPLPADFALTVHRRIVAESASPNDARRDSPLWQRLPKFAPVAAVAGLLVILLIALSQDYWSGGPTAPETTEVAKTERPEIVELADLLERFGESVKGPIPVTEWDPSGEPGVYAVVHKPNPEQAPTTFAVDYCGESDRLRSFRGSPWVRQKQHRLVARAGSPDNIYIIIIVLPESTDAERRRIERALLEQFQPFFNRRNGV